MTSLATAPRCEISLDASWHAAAAAAAASPAPSPFARNADTTPVRTSPLPAVASAGVPRAQTQMPEAGSAISVSAPFSRQTQPNFSAPRLARSEEHTSELQSRVDLVCRLLLEKKKQKRNGILISDTNKHQKKKK